MAKRKIDESTKQKIIELIKRGDSQKEVAKKLNIHHGSVAYYSKKAGLKPNRPNPNRNRTITKKYNWDEIQKVYDKYSDYKRCLKEFNIQKHTWYRAIHHGLLKVDLQPHHTETEKLCKKHLVKGDKKISNNMLKRLLLHLNTPYACVLCEQKDEWNGKPLVLQLDHINGDNTDNRISNIRLLCPNCHTQTATYANKKRNYKPNHRHANTNTPKTSKHGTRHMYNYYGCRCSECVKTNANRYGT